jgi:hypothetical protein
VEAYKGRRIQQPLPSASRFAFANPKYEMRSMIGPPTWYQSDAMAYAGCLKTTIGQVLGARRIQPEEGLRNVDVSRNTLKNVLSRF